MALHVTLDSAWTLVTFPMEDSSERDSEPVSYTHLTLPTIYSV